MAYLLTQPLILIRQTTVLYLSKNVYYVNFFKTKSLLFYKEWNIYMNFIYLLYHCVVLGTCVIDMKYFVQLKELDNLSFNLKSHVYEVEFRNNSIFVEDLSTSVGTLTLVKRRTEHVKWIISYMRSQIDRFLVDLWKGSKQRFKQCRKPRSIDAKFRIFISWKNYVIAPHSVHNVNILTFFWLFARIRF